MILKQKLLTNLLAAGLAIVMTTGIACASTATVTADALHLRKDASSDSESLSLLTKGTEVELLEEEAQDGWYKVSYNGVEGYMSAEWLTTEEVVKEGLVTADVLNVRSGADTSYDRVATLKAGETVVIEDDSIDGWYQITCGDVKGYVSAQYVVILGDGQGTGELGAAAVAVATQLLGCRYAYGGTTPSGFDCSGFTSYIYKQLGYSIPHGSSSQYYKAGYFVSLSELLPGDLIFFFDRRFDSSGGTLPTTHVGMYVGNGQFIHASTTSYRVQYDSMSGYYAPYIVAAKRIG